MVFQIEEFVCSQEEHRRAVAVDETKVKLENQWVYRWLNLYAFCYNWVRSHLTLYGLSPVFYERDGG